MFRHLTSCRDQLLVQLQHSRPLPRITELHTILSHLSDNEKQYLRNLFLKSTWNVGSTIVLAQLQRSFILTMTDYIWQQFQVYPQSQSLMSSYQMIDSEEMDKQTGESVQLILNDLLETEFSLLADLTKNIGGSDAVELKVFDVLRECFKRLVGDLSANPELVQISCLLELRKHLRSQEMAEVENMIWGVFDEMESCSVLEAIEQQSIWNQETLSSSMKGIMRGVASDEVQFIGKLLGMLRSPDTFTGWHWWLRFYGVFISNDSLPDVVFLTVRQQLKEIFRKFHQSSNSDGLFHAMMLCARQTCRFSPEGRFESYAKWYKNQIGEMQYGLTKDEFRRTMQTMHKMIKHEMDVEVLEVHAKTSIAAPAFCGDSVLSFKQVSKSWLEDLRTGRVKDRSVMMICD